MSLFSEVITFHCLLLVVKLATGETLLLLVLARYSLQNSRILKSTTYLLQISLDSHCKIRLLLGCKIHLSQNSLITRCKDYNFSLYFVFAREFLRNLDKVFYLQLLE